MGTHRVATSFRARLLMVCGSVLATLLVLEFLLFPLLLPWMPLRLHVYLGDGIRPLAQSSKRAALPRDYVMLVGDSYAQGRGDWLIASDPNRNLPFHSAHVIHELTGLDVVSFARGGAGSIRGFVTDPIASFHYLDSSPRFRIEQPAVIVAYYYEGNDPYDTLLELHHYFGGIEDWDVTGDAPVFDPKQFRQVVERQILGGHPLQKRADGLSLGDLFPFLGFVANLLAGEIGGPIRGEVAAKASPPPQPLQRPDRAAPKNVLLVRGARVPIATGLQGPAPELSEEQTRAALYALEQSLWILGEAFLDSRLCLVYVPSPAACYEHGVDRVLLQTAQGLAGFAPALVYQRSRALRARVGEVAARSADVFVDATPELQEAAREHLIHGPVDPKHLNRRGYTVLGRAASRCLDHEAAGP